MKARHYSITLLALGALGLGAVAQDAKNYNYHSSAKAQSADEVEALCVLCGKLN